MLFLQSWKATLFHDSICWDSKKNIWLSIVKPPPNPNFLENVFFNEEAKFNISGKRFEIIWNNL